MIKQGDKIKNARTGQTMMFLQTATETDGELLQIDCISPPVGKEEPVHIHPVQESRVEMISGTLHFSVDGKVHELAAGQAITIPAGIPHNFWNEGTEEAHYVSEFRPAGTIAEFFDTFFALSRAGKLNQKGIPNIAQGSLIMLKHKNDIRVVNPPWPLQVITYRILAPIGYLMGYRSGFKP